MAGRFSEGVIHLAGDAAHIHFGIGARGMNHSQMSENAPRELDLEKDYSEEFYGMKPGGHVIDKGTVSGDAFARMLGI